MKKTNNFNLWIGSEKGENSAENLKINIVDKDFIAINYPQASFYKDLELKSIPRYMLYKIMREDVNLRCSTGQRLGEEVAKKTETSS